VHALKDQGALRIHLAGFEFARPRGEHIWLNNTYPVNSHFRGQAKLEKNYV